MFHRFPLSFSLWHWDQICQKTFNSPWHSKKTRTILLLQLGYWDKFSCTAIFCSKTSKIELFLLFRRYLLVSSHLFWKQAPQHTWILYSSNQRLPFTRWWLLVPVPISLHRFFLQTKLETGASSFFEYFFYFFVILMSYILEVISKTIQKCKMFRGRIFFVFYCFVAVTDYKTSWDVVQPSSFIREIW